MYRLSVLFVYLANGQDFKLMEILPDTYLQKDFNVHLQSTNRISTEYQSAVGS